MKRKRLNVAEQVTTQTRDPLASLDTRHRRAGSHLRIFMLALGTFAIGTDGFMIAGILPSIARTTGVSVAAAGQLVTTFAWVYALASPLLGTLTANVGRKRLLVTALLIFSVANMVSALVPSFGWLFASRITAALGSALYTPDPSGVGSISATTVRFQLCGKV